MVKVCLLLPDLRGGGAERVSLDLGHAFAALGHQVEFALMRRSGDFLAEAEAAFPVADLAAPRVRQVLRGLTAHLRRSRPDVVLAAMWPLTVLAQVAQRLSGHRCRVIVSEHGMLSAQYGTWGLGHRVMLRASTMLGYRLADARVGVSAGVAADMARLSGMAASRFAAIHNPLRRLADPEVGQVAQAEALWQGQGPRIVTVGSLKPVKNHALLLQAFARLPLPQARLMIVGQGPDEGRLRQLVADLGLGERVILAGFHADPAALYATADLFALSSDHEGFGNVLVEALSFGLPVVSTDCPAGPAEILGGGRWGDLVPVRDAEALAAAMTAALSRPVNREALKARAAEFAPDIVARQYLGLVGLS